MKKIVVLGIAALAAANSHSAVVYDLNDTVLAGGTGANTFFVASGQPSPPAGLSYSPTGPSLTDTLSGSGQFTYFVAYFDSVTLTNLGDSITLNYSLASSSTSAFNNADETFRVGLFNSNGSQLTDNIAGPGDSDLNSYTGYAAKYRPRTGPIGSNNTFVQRTSTNNNLWTSGAFTNVPGTPTLVSPGTGSITGTFTLTLVATGIEITSVINGGTAQSIIDTTGLVTTFDSLSIFGLSGTANPTLTFSTLEVSFVPEPSSAMLLGAAGIALLGIRRRVRRAGL